MIIYGWRAQHRLTTELPENCKWCGSTDTLRVSIFQKYFHIFWIPLFPLDKQMGVECISCKNAMFYDAVPIEYRHYFDELKRQAKIPIWTFSALFVIAAIIIGVFVAEKVGDYQNGKMITALQKGDILDMKTAEGHYTLAKVTNVEGTRVYIVPSEYETNTSSNLPTLKIETFSTIEYGIETSVLKEMFEKGQIIDIERQ